MGLQKQDVKLRAVGLQKQDVKFFSDTVTLSRSHVLRRRQQGQPAAKNQRGYDSLARFQIIGSSSEACVLCIRPIIAPPVPNNHATRTNQSHHSHQTIAPLAPNIRTTRTKPSHHSHQTIAPLVPYPRTDDLDARQSITLRVS